ncbi:hypothetical protein [Reichenbachiella versicolor]|uniref:hypothetical protein n=1 Tax=Reichenbachiella versicolor TaxID=1821036 RepID=UPI000D6E3600|nr:hypothetical protein [Reichenbachiella versicolor]
MEILKDHLNTITDQLNPKSTLEDVYKQLAMLSDIEKSEQNEKPNGVYSSYEVKDRLNQWVNLD